METDLDRVVEARQKVSDFIRDLIKSPYAGI